jgi:hypothetical protein
VYFSRMEWANAGFCRHIFLMLGHSLEWPPSTEYATRVQGAPINPMREVLPSVSFLSDCQRDDRMEFVLYWC